MNFPQWFFLAAFILWMVGIASPLWMAPPVLLFLMAFFVAVVERLSRPN